jgi:hypothetical protein
VHEKKFLEVGGRCNSSIVGSHSSSKEHQRHPDGIKGLKNETERVPLVPIFGVVLSPDVFNYFMSCSGESGRVVVSISLCILLTQGPQ